MAPGGLGRRELRLWRYRFDMVDKIDCWISLDEAVLYRSYGFQAPDGRRFFGVFRNFDGRRILTVYSRRFSDSGVEVRAAEGHFELPLRPGWLCRLVGDLD